MSTKKKEWPTLDGAPPPSSPTTPGVVMPAPAPAPVSAAATAPAVAKPSIAGGAFWAMVFVSVTGIGLTLGFEVRAAKAAKQTAAANALATIDVPPPPSALETAPPPPSTIPQITAEGVVDSPPKKQKEKASATKASANKKKKQARP